MDRTDSLDVWLERISNLHPQKWDLGLPRVASVGARLGVLKPARKVILVAGTNGKGSACEVLEALCLRRGLSVGKSVSPHLTHFNERIVVDGKPVSDAVICDAFARIDAARGDTSLSYFEFAALAAMLVFNDRNLDVAVLEIGLGGRLDAMNIVDPDVSVITHIAMDHESWLGNDLDTIAREKAGIMRAGKPCIVADEEPPASLPAQALGLGATIRQCGRDFGERDGRLYIARQGQPVDLGELPVLRLPLPSALAALAAFDALFGLEPVDLPALANLGLAGRFQQISSDPRTIVDVAHNPDAAQRLAGLLSTLEGRPRCHAIFGMYGDKDIEAVVASVAPYIDAWYLTRVDEARAASTARLQDVVSGFGGSVAGTYDKVGLAYEDACRRCEHGEMILVFGSFPVVGEVMDHLGIPVYA